MGSDHDSYSIVIKSTDVIMSYLDDTVTVIVHCKIRKKLENRVWLKGPLSIELVYSVTPLTTALFLPLKGKMALGGRIFKQFLSCPCCN